MSLLAWQANSQRRIAEINEQKALAAEEEAEVRLLRGIAKPFVPLESEGGNRAETQSVWDLATLEDDRLRTRFVEEASHQNNFDDISNRAEPIMLGVAGLNEKLRDQIRHRLSEMLKDDHLSTDDQWRIMFLTLPLIDTPGSLGDQARSLLHEASPSVVTVRRDWLLTLVNSCEPTSMTELLKMTWRNDPSMADIRRAEMESINELFDQLSPEAAERERVSLVHQLLDQLPSTKTKSERSKILQKIESMAISLSAAEVRNTIEAFEGIFFDKRGEDSFATETDLQRSFCTLLADLGPNEASDRAAAFLDKLLEAISSNGNPESFIDDVQWIEKLAPFLRSADAHRAGIFLLSQFPNARNSEARGSWLLDATVNLSRQMEGAHAAEFADSLAALWKKERYRGKQEPLDEWDYQSYSYLADAMTELAPKLGADQAVRIADTLLKEILVAPKDDVIFPEAKAITKLCLQLKPEDASPRVKPVAEFILERKITRYFDALELVGDLSAQLPSETAHDFCKKVTERICSQDFLIGWASNGDGDRWADMFAPIASKISVDEASRMIDVVHANMVKSGQSPKPESKTYNTQAYRAIFIDVLAQALPPEKQTEVRRRASDLFQQSCGDEIYQSSDLFLLQVHLRLMSKFSPEEARRSYAQPMTGLIRRCSDRSEPEQFSAFTKINQLNALMNEDIRKRIDLASARSLVNYDFWAGDQSDVSLLDHFIQGRALSIHKKDESSPREQVERLKKSRIDAKERPCVFTTPQLVELLKFPTLNGKSRRLVLDHLENRYKQKFNTHWDFVRYAKEQQLGLDFDSPPTRPSPKELLVLADELEAGIVPPSKN